MTSWTGYGKAVLTVAEEMDCDQHHRDSCPLVEFCDDLFEVAPRPLVHPSESLRDWNSWKSDCSVGRQSNDLVLEIGAFDEVRWQ